MPSTFSRLRSVTIILALGTLAGMIFSPRVWVAEGSLGRTFPVLPVIEGMPQIPPPLDLALAGAMMGALLGLVMWPIRRWLHLCAVACGLMLMFMDLSRVQPWLLQYVLMLLVIGLRRSEMPDDDQSALTTLRWVIAFLYVYSGLHKVNVGFLTETAPKLIGPVSMLLPDPTMLNWIAYLMPLEALIGVAFFWKRTYRTGVIAAAAMHIVILLLIGPLGSNYNSVVWPWNATMMALNVVLFWRVDAPIDAARASAQARIAKWLAVILAGIVPIGGLVGFVDRYLSWAMYAGPPPIAAVTMTDAAFSRLPAELQSHFKLIEGDRRVIFILDWSFADINVVYPEERAYWLAARWLAERAGNDPDIRLVIVHAPPRWSKALRRVEFDIASSRTPE